MTSNFQFRGCKASASLIALILITCSLSVYAQKVKEVPRGFEMRRERVEVSPAYIRLEVTPAKFKRVTERVLVDAGNKTYKTLFKQVVERPATTREITVPAEFRTVERLVWIGRKPERAENPAKVAEVERKGPGPTYEWREIRVEIAEASNELLVIPAKFQTVTEQILLKEASDTTPAEYGTITRRKLVTPASVVEKTIPAQYQTVRRRVQVEPKEPERAGGDISDLEAELKSKEMMIEKLQEELRKQKEIQESETKKQP